MIALVRSFHSDRFGKIARKINIQALHNRQPVGDELEGNHVEETLETVLSLGHYNLVGKRSLELVVALVANDNRLATTCNNYRKS